MENEHSKNIPVTQRSPFTTRTAWRVRFEKEREGKATNDENKHNLTLDGLASAKYIRSFNSSATSSNGASSAPTLRNTPEPSAAARSRKVSISASPSSRATAGALSRLTPRRIAASVGGPVYSRGVWFVKRSRVGNLLRGAECRE